MMRIKLEVLSGPQDGHIFQFTATSDIGREGGVQLTADRFVSRRHATIEISDPNVFLTDQRSTNGTFVDDERLNGRVQLSNGKIFRVGRTWLQISW